MPVLSKKVRLSLLVLFYIFVVAGCQYQRSQLPPAKPFPSFKGKMAIAGFRAALTQGQAPGLVRSPISGAVFMAEPVSDSIVLQMNDMLLNLLMKNEDYDLISPNQVKGVFSSIISDDKSSLDDITVIKKIGKAFNAQFVLVGYLYRWQERDGTDYSVKQPASVAFDLYLIRSETGDIIWKGSFDKTQKSLMENLFDFSFFFKGKGKWMTARQLAELGLSKLIDLKNSSDVQ
jgi:hypothetical protein